jgi:hypothetical protein
MSDKQSIYQKNNFLMLKKKKIQKAGISGLIGVGIFLILSTINMMIYPGWYHINYVPYYSDRYLFIYNNLSDMGMLETFVGQSNIMSAVLFTLTLTLTGTFSIMFFRNFPMIFNRDSKSYKNARIGSIFGIISSAALVGVGWSPWDVLIIPHMIFVFLGFMLGIVYNILFAVAILQDKDYPNWFAHTMIVFVLILISYILALILGPPWGTVEARIIESLGQKIVTYSLMIVLSINAVGLLKMLQKKEQKITNV